MSTLNLPLFIFGSRHGVIHSLTPSNLPSLPGIQLSVGDFYDHKQTLQKLPNHLTLKKFLGYPQSTIFYLSPYDFYKQKCMSGCQNSQKVKIKCSKGYTLFDAAQYDQLAQLLNPQILVCLTEYPALENNHQKESNKGYKRAISKTTTYFTSTKAKHQNRKLMSAIHGGCNISLIKRSIDQVRNFDFDGFIVCDLCIGEQVEQRENVYKTIKNSLQLSGKKNYLLGLAGLGRIPDIEHAIQNGFSIFQVNYPFVLAEKHLALLYQNGQYIQHIPIKNQNLKPLSLDCQCKTCQNYSQAYISHLIECNQMNATIFLTMHNLHFYQKLINKYKLGFDKEKQIKQQLNNKEKLQKFNDIKQQLKNTEKQTKKLQMQ